MDGAPVQFDTNDAILLQCRLFMALVAVLDDKGAISRDRLASILENTAQGDSALDELQRAFAAGVRSPQPPSLDVIQGGRED